MVSLTRFCLEDVCHRAACLSIARALLPEVGDNVVSEPLTGCCDQRLDQRQRLEIEVAKYVQEFPSIWRAKTKREHTYADFSAI